MKDANYYFENPAEFDELSDELKEQLFENGSLEDVNDGESSDAETETDEADVAVEENEEPVILGKSGKHTIPYSELEDARSEAHRLREQAQQQAVLIEQLQAAKAQDEVTGGTAAQDAVVEAYEGMFPEVAADLKPLIQKMIEDGVQAALNARIAPVEEAVIKQTLDANDKLILAAHPDIVEILNKPDFSEWVEANPDLLDSRTRRAFNVQAVLDGGSPAQVTELMNQYKASINNTPVAAPVDISGKVKQIISGIKPKAPGTFSDLPGGITAQHDETEQVLAMSDAQLETMMLKMSEQERSKFFERMI